MKKSKKKDVVDTAPTIQRVNAPFTEGLSTSQVEERIEAGLQNKQPTDLTPSVGDIVRSNVFTFFNGINIFLAILILFAVGFSGIKNIFFLGIAFCNTMMGIFQELRSKKTLDKLSILAQGKVKVIRNGIETEVVQDDVVLDDIVVLSTGDQISSDSIVIEAEGFQVDESSLTGESDAIYKKADDTVMSGSFVTAGSAYVRVNAVGKENFATALTVEAKKSKNKQSQLMRTINHIIGVLTIVIVPVGVLLFLVQRYLVADTTFSSSVLYAATAMLGMIPEGLVLLTSVTMTVGAMNLAKKKALVQSLPSIETLARVDVLCLDKTGTITDGTLSFQELSLQNGYSYETASEAITLLMGSLHDNNATAIALRAAFPVQSQLAPAIATVPFSSARKWSAAAFKDVGTYIIGAPNFIFTGEQPFSGMITHYASMGYRVLALAYSPNIIEGEQLPEDVKCISLVVISDTIRKEAPDTFAYFEREGVELKVISGDDPLTVSTIARKAEIKNSEKYVDMSQFGDDDDFTELVKDTVVFGRVSPHQKRGLIHALQKNGHTTCMTGDGVNDVLAMKESDCSVSMINGSDAARSACDFVLMTSDFSAMINALKEGRRVINNIETVSTMYLVKTIYSILLSLIYTICPIVFTSFPFSYPFISVQMGPINTFTVGIPSFFLSLRANYKKPEGRFVPNVLEIALPGALTILFSIFFIQLAGLWFNLTALEVSTMNVLLTGTITLILMTKIARPFDWKILTLVILCFLAFFSSFDIFGWFYELGSLFTRNVLFYLPLIYACYHLFNALNRIVISAEDKHVIASNQRKEKKAIKLAKKQKKQQASINQNNSAA